MRNRVSADQHNRASSVDVGQFAIERRHGGRSDEIGRDHPRQERRAAQRGADGGQRRSDDGAESSAARNMVSITPITMLRFSTRSSTRGSLSVHACPGGFAGAVATCAHLRCACNARTPIDGRQSFVNELLGREQAPRSRRSSCAAASFILRSAATVGGDEALAARSENGPAALGSAGLGAHDGLGELVVQFVDQHPRATIGHLVATPGRRNGARGGDSLQKRDLAGTEPFLGREIQPDRQIVVVIGRAPPPSPTMHAPPGSSTHPGQPPRRAGDRRVEPARAVLAEGAGFVEQRHMIPLRPLRLMHGQRVADNRTRRIRAGRGRAGRPPCPRRTPYGRPPRRSCARLRPRNRAPA